MLNRRAEEIGDRGVQVDRGGQRAYVTVFLAWPPDQKRDPAQFAVDGRGRLSEDVVLAEVVPVIGAQNEGGRCGKTCVLNRFEQMAEPTIDQGELGPVVGPDMPSLPRIELSAG